jgi:hypothetical protein
VANHRLFYAIKQVGFAEDGTQAFTAAHGVQSVGITTNFNLEQVFELGQISIYENIEQVPEVEVTMEKVLDGTPLLYHLATAGSTDPSLVGRSTVTTIVGLAVFSETNSSATGTPLAEVQMSGMVVSSLNYSFPVEGSCTESVSLVGNHKVWRDVEASGGAVFSGQFNNNDSPTLHVQQRKDVMFTPQGTGTQALDENGATNQVMTVLPTEIYGVTSSGTIPNPAAGNFAAPIQSITVSCDLGRTPLFELGRKFPYFRYAVFPAEVRTDIETIATKMDNVSATEAGGQNGAPAGYNLKNQTIRVRLRDTTYLDMGKKNKLTSVSWSGGDATTGGNNVTNRFSYITSSDLTITQDNDPSGL